MSGPIGSYETDLEQRLDEARVECDRLREALRLTWRIVHQDHRADRAAESCTIEPCPTIRAALSETAPTEDGLAERFLQAARERDFAAERYEANAGTPDLTNRAKAAAFRIAASWASRGGEGGPPDE